MHGMGGSIVYIGFHIFCGFSHPPEVLEYITYRIKKATVYKESVYQYKNLLLEPEIDRHT